MHLAVAVDHSKTLKDWYSSELATLSAINSSLSESLTNSSQKTLHAIDFEEDTHAPATSLTSVQWVAPISTALSSSLDPFAVSIVDITPRQQSLLQFFIRDYSPVMFGTSEMALYSPSQAVGLPSLRFSRIAVRWICILADEIIHALNGRKRSRELSLQRSRGYIGLKSALRNCHTDFEEALLGIVIAGLVEYSFGDARAQSLHTVAADMLIHSQGGVENAIRGAPHLEPFYIQSQYAFGRCRILSLSDLKKVMKDWLRDLRNILSTDRSLWRGCDSKHDDSIPCHCMTLESDIINMISGSLALEEASSFAVGMQLSLLLEIVSTLKEFSGHCLLATKYFTRIMHLSYHSMISTRSSGERCELRAGTLASICSRARRDVIGQEQPQNLLASDTRLTEKNIVALKAFGYLQTTSQSLVISRLTSWLQITDEKADLIDDDDLKIFETEAVETWRHFYATTDKNQASPSQS